MMSYNIIHDSAELRKLVAENPDLPIAILVGEDAASDDYAYTYCSEVSVHIDEILDCEPPFDNDGYIITDRDEFMDRLQEWMEDRDEYINLTDEQFDAALNAKCDEYEPYWKKCICIRATN
jgi:hypothetical protein